MRVLLFLSFVLAASTAPANLPRTDDGVLLFNGNGKNGWESALDQMTRGGGGAAMMWSGWGPGGMTAITSTGQLGDEEGGLEPPSSQGAGEERTPRAGPADHPGYEAANGNGNNGYGVNRHRGLNGKGLTGNGNERSGNGHNLNGHNGRTDDQGSRSSAAASFNAWFPIVVGMMPGSGARSGQDDLGGGWPPVAAIANSVSHGERGVATSHAVAYGSQPAFRGYRNEPQPNNDQAAGPPSARYYGGRQR